MARVDDVATYILERCGAMTAMKLQKLVYYSQAWHLVWEERPLFDNPIEAWANGPVVRDIYYGHRGQFSVSRWSGDASNLTPEERSTIDVVTDFYSGMTAHQLSELTHSEDPWRRARAGVPSGTRSAAEISQAAMYEYYDGLTSTTTGD